MYRRKLWTKLLNQLARVEAGPSVPFGQKVTSWSNVGPMGTKKITHMGRDWSAPAAASYIAAVSQKTCHNMICKTTFQNQNHYKKRFQIKITNHQKWLQITISNESISNLSHHCCWWHHQHPIIRLNKGSVLKDCERLISIFIEYMILYMTYERIFISYVLDMWYNMTCL